MIRSLVNRWMSVALLGLVVLSVAGCSSNNGNAVIPTAVGVGVQIGASGSTNLLPGGQVILNAGVYNDSNNQGVTWALNGPGTLSQATTSQVTYTAPASGVTGAATATITATSIANTVYSSNITVTTSGAPQLLPQNILPANLRVGYGTSIAATGGVGPFNWAVVAGQLPPGLSLQPSNGGSVSILGTPTAQGSWTFTLQITDRNAHIDKGDFTIQVNPQASCLLQGSFSYLLHGFSPSGTPATRAGSFTVNADGKVVGSQDLKADFATQIGQPVIDGKCQNQIGNHGVITLKSAASSNTPAQTLTFFWTILSSLNEGYMQEADASGVAGTANFVRIDPATSNVSGVSSMAGTYALGVVGTDALAERLGVVGRMTVASDGTLSNASVDSNGSFNFTNTPVTGAFSAPDANGHGTLNIRVGSTPLQFSYYAVLSQSGRKVFLIASDAGASAPILAGELTAQASGLTNASFAPPAQGNVAAVPAILELWSATGSHYATSSNALGQITGVSPGAGTASILLDSATGGSDALDLTYPGSYNVSPTTGRLTYSFVGGAGLRTFVGYLNGISSGYLVETTPNSGNGYGLLEPQTGAPFTTFQGGIYLGTTVLPAGMSPLVLLSSVSVSSGSFGGGFTGQYALDGNTGRGEAELGRNLFGGTGLVFYVVNDGKLVLMGNGANAINTQIGWLFY